MGSANTQFRLSNDPAIAVKADGLIVPVFKKASAKDSKAAGNAKASKKEDAANSIVWPAMFGKALQAELEQLATEEKFDASRGKLLTLRQSAANKLGVKRLILVGLGEVAKVQPRHWESVLQKAMGLLLALKDPQAIAIALPEATETLSSTSALLLSVDAVTQSTYKSMEAKEPPIDLKTVTVFLQDAVTNELKAHLERAESLAQARSLVKDLVNHPANLKSTNTLVDVAQKIGKGTDIQVSVQKDPKWIEKNMPCFYTVARGSVASDPPKFITLRYTPKSGKAKKHIAIVGKSVIFDTGGYQVKPGDYMVTMKGDMTGGAVALATMQAIAALKPKNIAVTAYLAATPNKIDSDAMIPDSIVNTTCGKKVEIRHTDAEGRLTLIDAVAKALENKPDEILTIATLTGAASVAVGSYIALMGNNEALRDRVAMAGRSVGESIQTLDVTEDDYDNIKSKLDGADIINTSQRKNRGAQTAAAFVMSGASDDMPMAHMDIAGADMTPDEKATGVSVKTVIQYLLNENEQLGTEAASPKPVSLKSTSTKSTKTPSATRGRAAASSKKATTASTVKTAAKKAAPGKSVTTKAATAKTTAKAAPSALKSSKQAGASAKTKATKPASRKKNK